MGLLERYVAGEHHVVWREICEAGATSPEADSVAVELMTRVARNVDTVVGRLQASGYRFLSLPARTPSDVEDVEALAEAEELAGRLPLALRTCLTTVGDVCLAGTHPEWSRTGYLFDGRTEVVLADPLWLPPIGWVCEQMEAWAEADPGSGIELELAPDELHKANISGSTHDIGLPTNDVDPVVRGVRNRPEVRLVEYLRISLLQWGGFPGFEFEDEVPPQIHSLTEGLRPF